jgi:hypothetical protein
VLFLGSEVHKNLVLETFPCISREPRTVFDVEAVDRFYEPDRSDGDEVVLIARGCVIFFHDMRNEPKVVLDELVPRLEITAFCKTEKPFLLGFRERRRKGMSVGRAEKQTKAFRHDRKKKRQQNYHLLTRYAEELKKIRGIGNTPRMILMQKRPFPRVRIRKNHGCFASYTSSTVFDGPPSPRGEGV